MAVTVAVATDVTRILVITASHVAACIGTTGPLQCIHTYVHTYIHADMQTGQAGTHTYKQAHSQPGRHTYSHMYTHADTDIYIQVGRHTNIQTII